LSPKDLLTVNRVGDLLARRGQTAEAVRYYQQVATEFGQSGFLTKAIAVYKKVLRLEPHRIDIHVQLGEFYHGQKLAGDARKHLLHAAELYLRDKDFAGARDVYEKLVRFEPEDPRHRARLAEARAAEGDVDRAARDLLDLGAFLIGSKRPADAEKTYARAAELLPDDPEPALGLARSLILQERVEEGLARLEQQASRSDDPRVLGELFLQHATHDAIGPAVDVLRRPGAVDIPDTTFEEVFRHQQERGRLDDLWNLTAPVFDEWKGAGHGERLVSLYQQLAPLEDEGHVPALARLREVAREMGDIGGETHALEQLVRAHQLGGRTGDADRLLEELRSVAPDSVLVTGSAPPEPVAEPSIAQPPPRAREPRESLPLDGAVLEVAENPAVPTGKSDDEFVSGRMTQAEILEKYGLKGQAVEQVLEVTSKFPGHLPSQEKLVLLLRSIGDPAELRQGLIGLAVALRAGGDATSARQAVNEAHTISPLDPESKRLCERLGMFDPAVDDVPVAIDAEPIGDLPAEPPVEVGPSPISVAADAQADEVVLIDFDDPAPDGATVAETEPVAEPPPVESPKGEPPTDSTAAIGPAIDPQDALSLEEARFYLDQGVLDAAQKLADGLRRKGFQSAELDRLFDEIEEARSEASSGGAQAADDEDDLSAIAAVLEGELLEDAGEVGGAAEPPDAESEQSLEDVFAAFRQHVESEVETDDFRTHYDLGIAYKEMGLIREAIDEFTVAVKSGDLQREACTMIAVCHRDLDDVDEAKNWYLQAIDASGGDPETVSGLRYELAEVLLESGDRDGALSVFRDVLAVDATFRDVGTRIADLESGGSC
jgi:tetratricopeptide (TPR) repeat protein